MKLNLLLLALLFSLSSGFMAELRGPLTDETCSGHEYADFVNCIKLATEEDPNLAEQLTPIEQKSFTGGGQRKLYNPCGGCRGGAPKGHFCYTYCGKRRRELWELTDTPDTSSLEEDKIAVYDCGDYIGNDEAIKVAQDVMQCFAGLSENHPCLGSTDLMTMVVHTTLTDEANLFKSAGCLRGVRRHYQ
jgi:hypothetical protein